MRQERQYGQHYVFLCEDVVHWFVCVGVGVCRECGWQCGDVWVGVLCGWYGWVLGGWVWVYVCMCVWVMRLGGYVLVLGLGVINPKQGFLILNTIASPHLTYLSSHYNNTIISFLCIACLFVL